MKHYHRYLLAALVLIAIVIGVCAMTSSAATESNVIYIADDVSKGDGSGKDASNPLRAEERVTRSAPAASDAYKYYYAVGSDGTTSDSSKRFYYNSVLYQASEKLAATGGKIVLVGDVVLDYSKTYSGSSKTDRDFYMYGHGDKQITITAQNDAKLVLTEGARLSLGGKTVFEDITIATTNTANSTTAGVQNRSINCSGYETVFGYGIKCVNLDGDTAASYYPLISGGKRFGDLNGDSNVTIRSGTWGAVYGGNYGNSNNVHSGNSYLTIENGTFLGSVVAGERSAIHNGNSVLTIKNGEFKGSISAEGTCGVQSATNTAFVNIIDGNFSSISAIKKINGTLAEGKNSPELRINLAKTNADNIEIGYLLKNTDADMVSYPMSWCKSIEVVTPPSSNSCFVGREYDPSGLKIKLTYKNGSNTYESVVEYSKDDTNFEFDYNNSVAAIVKLVCKYAGEEFYTTEIAVIKNKVIYIANTASGKGDGSSADNAMGPTVVIERDEALDKSSSDYKYYMGKKVDANGKVVEDGTKNFEKNGVLYQAYEKLKETGGKIVLVGDVQLDFTTSMSYSSKVTRDVYLPKHGNSPIVITAQNDARLKITDGVILALGGSTLFENMTFATGSTALSSDSSQYNRAICADGNSAIFGNGISCVNDDGETEEKAFIAINGGTRYANLDKDSNVTIKSGKWAYVAGSSYGMEGYYHKGDIRMVIEGGEFIGNVSAVARYEAMHIHYGNAKLIIKGGTFHGGILGIAKMQTGYENSRIDIVVSGGNFVRETGQYFSYRYSPHARATGIAPYVTLDLSECTTFNDFSRMATNFDKVYYPSSLCTSVSVNKDTSNSKCFIGEDFNASGLEVTATYKDSKNTTKTMTVAYNNVPHAFGFEYDNSKAGTTQIKYSVGNVQFKTGNIEIINVPTPEILGAQVRVKNSNQTTALRFVAEMKKPFADGVSVKECGFIALNDFYFTDKSMFVVDGFYGPKNIVGTTFRADAGSIYNSNEKMTFAGEYPNLSVIDYDTDIAVIAYVEFTYGGKTYVRYSDIITRSVVDVAEEAMLSGIEKTESKEWMKTNLIDSFGAYTDSQLIDADKSNKYRNEVISAYDKTANYSWIPSSQIDITYDQGSFIGYTYDINNTYSKGTTYKGIPYVSGQKATIEEFTSYVQVFGGKNYYMGPIKGYKDVYQDTFNTDKYNQYLAYVDEELVEIEGFFPGCDYSVVTNAWNKVTSNKVWTTTIQSFIPNQGRGTVKVGSYDCGTSADTKNIAQTLNGPTVMNAAYALCKPGDALVSTSSSDVYMVKSAAGASSVEVWKFAEKLDTRNQTHFSVVEETFTNLYNNGFIPVTIPELATGERSETTVALSNFDGEKAIKDGVMNGMIESSRQIISVNVSILRNENALYDKTVYYNSAEDLNTNRVNLIEFNIANAVKFMVGGKQYVIRISADVGGLSTEQNSIVLHEYTYTKPVVNSADYYSFVDSFEGYNFSEATADMPQTAIDYMYEQYNSYYWSPEFDFKMGQLVVNGDEFVPSKTFYASNIYKGVVYADYRATLGDFQEYMSGMPLNSASTTAFGTNVYTFKLPAESQYTDGSGEVRYDWTKFVGNHCSAAMFHSYNQNSRIAAAGSRNNPDLVLVGFAEDIFYYLGGKLNDTRNITKVFGEAAMYSSYAQAQKGDYMYRNTGGGHTRMVKDVYVEYNSDGTINGNKSWIRVVEQTDTPVLMKELKDNYDCDITDAEYNNPNAYSTWYMNKRYYFSDLASDVVIYRPTEYITNETEKPYVALKSPVSVGQLSASTASTKYITGFVESNYPIISLKMEIKNSSGKVVATAYKRAMNAYSYNLKNLANLFDTYPTANGTYSLTLTAELSVGQAVLVKDLQF
ncbi:MAG: bacterial Ig-like domain-containing protein, partial [Clostridia bacterium]|nr:bacterial Ig-like domain-containing protein [Clostridia bacterium]